MSHNVEKNRSLNISLKNTVVNLICPGLLQLIYRERHMSFRVLPVFVKERLENIKEIFQGKIKVHMMLFHNKIIKKKIYPVFRFIFDLFSLLYAMSII